MNPNWKEDNKDNVTERKYKDLVKQKQSTWIPGKPGRPPAWAADYVQKQKTKYTWTPGKPGRPPAWAAEYVQKQKEEKEEKDLVKKKKPTTDTDKPKTKWQQPGDKGRPPLWAKEYDWY